MSFLRNNIHIIIIINYIIIIIYIMYNNISREYINIPTALYTRHIIQI